MTDIFDGDPYLTLDADGAEITFQGNGQPVMDTGLENQVNLSQFTASGHWSEDLEPDPKKRYTGLLLEAMKQPVTRQSLINMARAAELDAKDPVFSKIQSIATNPVGQQILISTQYTPISGDPFVLRLENNGRNYINQIQEPAHLKI